MRISYPPRPRIAQSPSVAPSPVTYPTLETNAARAELAYRNTLQELFAADSTSATARWDMNGYDRIY